MGGGSKAPATTTTIQKTELPAWLEGITRENLAIADTISKRPYEAYQGSLTAGFSPEQEAAFRYMQEGVGATTPLYQRAAGVTNDVASYQPINVGNTWVNPGSIGFERVGAGQIGAERVGAGQVGFERVNAPSFLTGNVDAYMNPYISNVENAALQRLEGATKQAVNRIGDQARAAGAFGGSRQGIAEGTALGEAARSAGELSANLRSQGYNQAAALMQADQQRAMQAALSNQAAGIQTGQFNTEAALRAAFANQQAGLQAGQFNTEAALRAALANQAAGITTGQTNLDANMRAQLANQQANMQAQLANQSAGLQGANLRMGAAGQLADLGTAAQRARITDASMIENIGMQRQAQQQALLDEAYARWNEQRNYPIEMLNMRLGATSATPYSQTTTGTSTAPRQSGNGLMTGLGAAASVASIVGSLAPVIF